MDKHIIVGVHMVNRTSHSATVQSIFTEYGCQIKTRIGLHDVHDDYCSPNGLILLEVIDMPETYEMIEKLQALDGVDLQKIEFDH
jgi:hypothetical protein